MKKENWFKALNLADDKYVNEANPDVKVKHNSRKKLIMSLVAAAACLTLMMCNLWLFLPFKNTPPDVSQYSDSEYYEIIQKLNLLTWEESKYKNNFEILKVNLSNKLDFLAKEDSAGYDNEYIYSIDGDISGGADGTYKEVTDNQVEGIVEADRIKRSDKHIYYLDNQTLRVFSIAGIDSMELGHIDLFDYKYYYQYKWEFYLSKDCKTVTVIMQYYDGDRQPNISVIALDVSDPANITEKNRVEITGSYMSSRMTEGKLLLLTEFVFNKKDIDFDDESTFLPQINTGDGMKTIPANGITSPDEINNTRYTIVMKLDENTLNLEGTAAYLSYSEDVYVSKDHIFLTHVFADIKKGDDGKKIRNSMTEISCLTYGGSIFEKKGSATVRGYVKDQWSMDEYEGILRVVTTTNATTVSESSYRNGQSISADALVIATGNSNASLYCVDLKTFKVVASVEDFAPPREKVQSVRFDKDTAYVCTSIEMSDPVFFFDLSDINNITYKDTGTIEGFSTSLVNFGNGKLLGIGRGSWRSLKVEIYEETKDEVVGFCKYEFEGAGYSPVYKSYYIDRENQLVGLGIRVNGDTRYIVLYFDGYDLIEVANIPLNGDVNFQRGVYVDGYMYMFGENDFKVLKLF